MTGPVGDYLQRCVPGRNPDLPETIGGTLRLDVHENAHTTHFRITIDRQNVTVTRSAEDADLVVRGEREVFEQLAAGQANIGSALLRNDVTAEGKLPLLLSLRRIFPGPPQARHPREFARERGGRP